jgi:hypothetical protein
LNQILEIQAFAVALQEMKITGGVAMREFVWLKAQPLISPFLYCPMLSMLSMQMSNGSPIVIVSSLESFKIRWGGQAVL